VTKRYFSQLNGLRALAVVAVVATHTVDTDHHPWLVWAEEGVTLFFVISGFLITGILLDARDEAAAARVGRGSVLRAFYARRFLRIFPVYYATIVAAAVIGFNGVRAAFLWHATYLSNWYIAFDRNWNVATHAWSLAVEEQFYLLWPLVLLSVPRRFIPRVIAVAVAIGPTTRVVLLAGSHMWHPGIAILTPSCLDPLALGAGLAWAWRSERGPTRFVRSCLVAAALLFVVDRAVAWGPGSEIAIAVTRLWIPLAFVGLVHAVSTGSDRAVARPLTWRPVVHVGLVSYGMYLFHPFIEALLHRLAARLDVPLGDHGIVLFAIVLALTVPAATLSWHWFESPINRRKARHPYVRSAPTTAPVASP